MSKYRLVINAGHGMKNNGTIDVGAVGATGYKEYIETKELADLVSMKLKYNDIETLVIQDGDLWDVTNQSNNWKADYFISIHCNSFSADSHGVETFSLASTGKGRQLAQAIHKELIPATGLYDRGLKTANYHVLRETNCPAVLTEVGFISNPKEEALMKDYAWDEKVSTAIVKGICNFLKIQYKQIINNNQKEDDFQMEYAIFYFSDRDFSVARMVSSRLGNCAMYCREGNNTNVHKDIKYVKIPIIIGGAEYKDNPNTINLCGYHDYDTAAKVVEFVKTL